MLKKLSVIALLLFVFAVSGCTQEFELDKDYNYSGVSFNVSSSLKDEDMGAFYPALNTEVRTINQLKKYIEDNIDKYSIKKSTANGTERIYLLNTVEKVKFTQEQCFVTIDGDTQSYTYTENENVFTVVTDEEVLYTFYFEKGKICYSIEFIQGFEVVHNFK